MDCTSVLQSERYIGHPNDRDTHFWLYYLVVSAVCVLYNMPKHRLINTNRHMPDKKSSKRHLTNCSIRVAYGRYGVKAITL